MHKWAQIRGVNEEEKPKSGSSVRLPEEDELWIKQIVAVSNGRETRTSLIKTAVKLLRIYAATHGRLPPVEIPKTPETDAQPA